MYQALYSKWRPRTFSDVLSQPQVTVTLRNQVKAGTTVHAYLFTGSRGTGKTTCARILAKAVNCEHPTPEGDPCLTCSLCQMAEQGTLADLVEIDAASNNSVEDIRDLRDASVYLPEKGKFRIYIIDEVHMLSASAFNALLKIMEEPPPYMKFILATTEIHKVPATIISRCQRYDFRRIQQEDLVSRLMMIAEKENISLEPNAAKFMARLSDGGMRDAISLLDRCSAYGETITVKLAAEAAGAADRNYLFQLMEAILEKNIPNILKLISDLYQQAKDLQRLCEELILLQRDVLLYKVTGNVSLLNSLPEEISSIEKFSGQELSQILTLLQSLQDCREKLYRATDKRITLEMSLIRLCTNFSQEKNSSLSSSADLQEILQRLSRLEQQPNEPLPQKLPPLPAPRQNPEMKKFSLSDCQPLPQWAEILERCEEKCPDVGATLLGSSAVFYENYLMITTGNPLFMALLKRKENAKPFNKVLFDITGKQFTIRAKCSPEALKSRPIEEMIQRAKNSGVSTTAIE